MRPIYFLISSCCLVFCGFACAPTTDGHGDKEKDQTNPDSHEAWTYEGESGPDRWAELEVGGDCGGQFQSPININTTRVIDGVPELNSFDVEYEGSTEIISVTNNGHSIQYNFDSRSNHLIFRGDRYTLTQAHFHSPSEHTVNGIRYPLEIHLVHQNQESKEFVVVGAFAQQGPSDLTFTILESFLPIEVGETKKVGVEGNLMEAFPETEDDYTWQYNGSLTTPPCTESVHWILYKNPIEVSEEQIEILRRLMPLNNYRDTQPRNGREVVSDQKFHEAVK